MTPPAAGPSPSTAFTLPPGLLYYARAGRTGAHTPRAVHTGRNRAELVSLPADPSYAYARGRAGEPGRGCLHYAAAGPSPSTAFPPPPGLLYYARGGRTGAHPPRA